MPTRPQFRESVLTAKEHLAAGREKLRQQHAAGSPGIQVCAYLTDLLDAVVLEIYEAALADLGESGVGGLANEIALVPHGGYGRRDVAPYSDVDLLLLHRPLASGRVSPLARRLVMDISDVGLDLGFSVRTSTQACQLGRRDPVIFTSQAEARYLAGSVRLFAAFMRRYRRMATTRWRPLVDSMDKARRAERAQYGETVFLLEPNIKRSRGGLRDIHLLRWIGFARFGEGDPKSLHLVGELSADELGRLRKATEFLLRLRNELHFHGGKAHDVMYRDEQVRVARLWGYEGQEGVLPVEQFMRDYFAHTSWVRNVVGNALAAARQKTALAAAVAPLISHQVERDFRVGPVHISATRRGLAKLPGNLAEVLRLMDLANLYNRRIEHATWQAIREDMSPRQDVDVSEEAAKRFLSILSQTPRLGGLLRQLHELHVLEKLISGMDHARCLLQFNTYHKYTVDEHCIRAVEQATDFNSDGGQVGEVYRQLKKRHLLHLTLLVHDLGKGYTEDHSEVGQRLAVATARRLMLSEKDTETLRFLVHKHLLMTHLAFRRDTSDESVILQFAMDVGSPERLSMLYVLTCADMAAVGPGVLNRWKTEVLTELYGRTMHYLSGGAPSPDLDRRMEKLRQKVRAAVPDGNAEWFSRQIGSLPPAYLMDAEPKRIASDLQRLCSLGPGDAVAWGRYLEDRRVVEYTVGAHEGIVPAIFQRLTGALTGQGLQILSAEIHSLADQLVMDRFYVNDPDHAGRPPDDRFVSVSAALVNALQHPTDEPPTFRRVWQGSKGQAAAKLQHLPTRIVVDNNTSQKFTILDVFAHDRMGLLYTISRTLYELETSVGIARIGTYLDQVVDVFYITDRNGEKITDETRLEEIRARLLNSIDRE